MQRERGAQLECAEALQLRLELVWVQRREPVASHIGKLQQLFQREATVMVAARSMKRLAQEQGTAGQSPVFSKRGKRRKLL